MTAKRICREITLCHRVLAHQSVGALLRDLPEQVVLCRYSGSPDECVRSLRGKVNPSPKPGEGTMARAPVPVAQSKPV